MRAKVLSKGCLAWLRVLSSREVAKSKLGSLKDAASYYVFIETSLNCPIQAYVEFQLNVPGRENRYLAHGIVRRQDRESPGIEVEVIEMREEEPPKKSPAEKLAADKEKALKAAEDEAAANAEEVFKVDERLPSPDAIANHVGQLLGMQLSVTPCAAMTLDATDTLGFGVYITDDGTPVNLWAFDMAFACGTGAALSMMPAGTVRDAMRGNQLEDTMVENVREVLNVAASLHNSPETPHIKLKEIIFLKDGIPADLAAIIAKPEARLDATVTVPNYGTGKIAVLKAPEKA